MVLSIESRRLQRQAAKHLGACSSLSSTLRGKLSPLVPIASDIRTETIRSHVTAPAHNRPRLAASCLALLSLHLTLCHLQLLARS